MTEYVKQGYRHGVSICSKCASNEGCTWPEDHVATWWQGTCGYCGKDNPINFDDPDDIGGVTSAEDWDWPGKEIVSGDLSRREL